MKTLAVLVFAAVVGYSLGSEVDAQSRNKRVSATLITMGGIDKTKWILNVPMPECGDGEQDSKYETKIYSYEDDLKVVCRLK